MLSVAQDVVKQKRLLPQMEETTPPPSDTHFIFQVTLFANTNTKY